MKNPQSTEQKTYSNEISDSAKTETQNNATLQQPENTSQQDLTANVQQIPAADPEKSPADDALPEEPAPSSKRKSVRSSRTSPAVPVHRWFVTFMCMNIPIFGWIYLLILAFSPSKGPRRDFAKAYLIYKLIFLMISLAILAVAFHYGMELLDQLLAYMEML